MGRALAKPIMSRRLLMGFACALPIPRTSLDPIFGNQIPNLHKCLQRNLAGPVDKLLAPRSCADQASHVRLILTLGEIQSVQRGQHDMIGDRRRLYRASTFAARDAFDLAAIYLFDRSALGEIDDSGSAPAQCRRRTSTVRRPLPDYRVRSAPSAGDLPTSKEAISLIHLSFSDSVTCQVSIAFNNWSNVTM